MMAVAANSRRIILSLRNHQILSSTWTGPRIGAAWCSSSSSSSNKPGIPESQPVKNLDITQSQAANANTAGWDLSAVEHLLQDVAQKDMPVRMSNPYEKELPRCLLCHYNITLDYKNPRLLSQFVSPYTGKLYGRNVTRLCEKQHELLDCTITKSRQAGYMAVMLKSLEFLNDPKLVDPNNPIKPHNY